MQYGNLKTAFTHGMPSSSYTRGLITQSQADEATLTEVEECRIADVIDDGLTPLTVFENNLIQILAGKAKPCCPKETAMAEFASTLDGGIMLKRGFGWASETEQYKWDESEQYLTYAQMQQNVAAHARREDVDDEAGSLLVSSDEAVGEKPVSDADKSAT